MVSLFTPFVDHVNRLISKCLLLVLIHNFDNIAQLLLSLRFLLLILALNRLQFLVDVSLHLLVIYQAVHSLKLLYSISYSLAFRSGWLLHSSSVLEHYWCRGLRLLTAQLNVTDEGFERVWLLWCLGSPLVILILLTSM